MTIKELKTIIKDLPDDMEVRKPGFDHSYNQISWVRVSTALIDNRHYSEYYNEPLEKGEKTKDILVIE